MTAKKSPSASAWATKFDRPATAPTKDTSEPATESRRRSPRKPVTDNPRQKAEKPRTRTRKAPAVPEEAAEPVPVPPVAPPAAPMMPSRRRAPAKRAVTYRLTDEVLDLIDLAVATAAERGERLTKEEAVAVAIRRTYNRLTK